MPLFNIKREEPGPGQESVWDYPRPPRVEKTPKRIRIVFNGETIVDSTNAYRVLETSHPPAYYIPQEDIKMDYFTPTKRRTLCEFKGAASYYTIEVNGKVAENAAWTYNNPNPNFSVIKGYLSFYPSPMDACYVNDEKAVPQQGDFYGSWITSDIVGPFKGGPGTRGW